MSNATVVTSRCLVKFDAKVCVQGMQVVRCPEAGEGQELRLYVLAS